MPRLLIDKEKCLRNIEKMVRKAALHHLSLRPHFKTHQSAEIGSWFMDFGVKAITVSSFEMARYFAEAGWTDILVAFPFHPGEMDALIRLSDQCLLSILVDSPAVLPFLNHIPYPVRFYVDVDTGYGRTGIRAEQTDLIEQVIVKAGANPRLEFAGFYCHAGHSYKAADPAERTAIHRKAIGDLEGLKNRFGSYGPRILYGDTPNCSVQEDFGRIDEITPGNFVFYDLIQLALGACSMEEIAVAMECPVAGRYPSKGRILVHGGAIHFSKDTLMKGGSAIFGQLVAQTENGWEPADAARYLSNLTQEHGILECDTDLINRTGIGENLLFLPVHSCLTANLMRTYHTLDGQVVTTMNS